MSISIKSCFTAVLFASIMSCTASAEFRLDLIAFFNSDSTGGQLWEGATTCGDLDGDGYCEIVVAESGGERRLQFFRGGNPPDTFPDKIIGNYGWPHAWIPDISGDGRDDFAMRERYQDSIEVVDIWFGGEDFFTKVEPDLQLINATDTFTFFGRTFGAGDINGDSQNDLIISASNGEVYPYDGRYYIYYGGDLLDTFVDDCIDFFDQGNGYNDFSRNLIAGDINSDGLVDFVYSGRRNDSPSYIAVIFGSVPPHNTPDHVFWTPYTEDNMNFDNFGEYLYSVGDINRDGYADFVVTGQALWACLYFGGDPFYAMPFFLGDTTDESTRGTRVANIGDINHDGWDDIGTGYPALGGSSGIVNIIYGYETMDGQVDLVLPESDAWPYVGREYGYSIGPAGDFNGDGIDDLVVTAADDCNLDFSEGIVYVYAGDPNLPTDVQDGDGTETLPTEYNILEQNYPNPFNSETVIEYALKGLSRQYVELTVYNMLGQRVRSLWQGVEGGGKHVVSWDGLDDRGKEVPSGIYFYL
ncbi:MAG: FG-GAP repeat protein, partial [Proteobacteria bacterium]|nr:FG-GAP repeat protein [Pseudomonadota bacterium]